MPLIEVGWVRALFKSDNCHPYFLLLISSIFIAFYYCRKGHWNWIYTMTNQSKRSWTCFWHSSSLAQLPRWIKIWVDTGSYKYICICIDHDRNNILDCYCFEMARKKYCTIWDDIFRILIDILKIRIYLAIFDQNIGQKYQLTDFSFPVD